MTASGVAEGGDAIEIEIVLCGAGAEGICCIGDIEERAGIAAVNFVHAAVFDVPDGDTLLAEVFGGPVHQRAVGDRFLPATAMDHQHDGMRTRSFGKPEVRDVGGAIAPLDRLGGRDFGAGQEIVPREQTGHARRLL